MRIYSIRSSISHYKRNSINKNKKRKGEEVKENTITYGVDDVCVPSLTEMDEYILHFGANLKVTATIIPCLVAYLEPWQIHTTYDMT